jgi:hypothetical protein
MFASIIAKVRSWWSSRKRRGYAPAHQPKQLGPAGQRRIELGKAFADLDLDAPTRKTWLVYHGSEALPLELSERGEPIAASAVTLSLEEQGRPGLRWRRGLPTSHENNTAFRPTVARGRRGNLGTFWELFVTSTTYRRTWSGIAQALVTGLWKMEPALSDDMDEVERAEESARARACLDALMNIEGGWNQFLRNALFQLIAGFAVFEEVYRDVDDDFGLAGSIRKLAFRFPGTVQEWVLDDMERDLLAVTFEYAEGDPVTIPAEDLLLYSYDKFGNNFEGLSPMRTVGRWIQALQECQLHEMVAVEKFGNPWVFARRTGENLPLVTEDESTLVDIIDAAVAAENPVIVLPDNSEIEITSPAGQMPNLEPIKRFCLERIAEILKAEGSLIGLGETGAFAARMDASSEFVRFAPYFAFLVAEPLNGADNTPYTGTIPKMYKAMFGEPLRPGAYPKLSFSIGDLEDEQAMAKLQMGIASGTVVVTPEVQEHVHKKLNLPPPPRPQTTMGVVGLARGESDAV